MVLVRDSERPQRGAVAAPRTMTLGQIGRDKLECLSHALGLRSAHARRAQEVFDHLSYGWAHVHAGDGPAWPTDITDEGAPFELSVAFTGSAPHVRVLVENHLDSGESPWSDGLALNRRLQQAGLCDLSRFALIEDLFRPSASRELAFQLWHAAVIPESGAPLIKLYVNPRASDRPALSVVGEAMARLGHARSWAALQPTLAQPGNEVLYFSVDLDAGAQARVKVYVGRNDEVENIEHLVRGAVNLVPGQASEWIEALSGRRAHFTERPILACFAYASADTAPMVTLHVPVRCYLGDDAEALRRVRPFLSEPDAVSFERALAALAPAPLERCRGVLTYASLSPKPGRGLSVTTYLAPKIFAAPSELGI